MRKSCYALLVVFVTIACQTEPQTPLVYDGYYSQNPDPAGSAPQFSSVVNKDWFLAELWIDQKNTGFDRSQLAEFSTADRPLFTVRFEADRAGGTGAPNHFGSPYSLADDQAITFGLMMATQMAPLFEPGKLREHEYFVYLQNAYKWNLAGGRLELYSKDNDGAEVLTVFLLHGSIE